MNLASARNSRARWVLLTRRAAIDLREIARQAQACKGARASDALVRELEQACQDLLRDPNSGRNLAKIRPGYRGLPCAGHVLLYRETANGILIVRLRPEATLAMLKVCG
jgi:plasmid stabilization system protein ParE